MKTIFNIVAASILIASCGTREIPLVFDRENTASEYEVPETHWKYAESLKGEERKTPEV